MLFSRAVSWTKKQKEKTRRKRKTAACSISMSSRWHYSTYQQHVSHQKNTEIDISSTQVWLFDCLFVSRIMQNLTYAHLEGWDTGQERTRVILAWIRLKGGSRKKIFMTFFDIARCGVFFLSRILLRFSPVALATICGILIESENISANW